MVILAGPVMNILIAFAILWAIFVFDGQVTGTTTRASVEARSPRPSAPARATGSSPSTACAATADDLRRRSRRTRCAGRADQWLPRHDRQGHRSRATASCGAAGDAALRPDGQATAARLRLRRERRARARWSAAGEASTGMWRVTTATVDDRQSSTTQGAQRGLRRRGHLRDDAADDRASTSTQALIVLAHHLAVAGHREPLPVPAARRRPRLLGAGREGPGPADPVRSWSAPASSGFVLVIVLFVIGLTNDIDRLRGEGFGIPADAVWL